MIDYSIIIPHYNTPRLLERCVNSIPNRQNVQVIVVDDCSPCQNELFSVIDGIRRCREVELYKTPQGGSAGRARNVGLDHAKGNWVIFADADDFFDEDLPSILDKYNGNDEDILYFNCRSVYSDNIALSSKRIVNEGLSVEFISSPDKEQYLRFKHQVPWGKIIKRSLITNHRIRFDETKYANDAMFSALIGGHASKISFEKECLYVVTEREGSLCSNFFQKPGEALIRAKVALRVRMTIVKFGCPVDDEYQMFLKILLWQNEFKGIREIYRASDSYGVSKEEVLHIVKSNGLRYRPVYYWLKYLS